MSHSHNHSRNGSHNDGHAHAHAPAHASANDTNGSLQIAFFLNLLFTLLEIVGGLWTNSLAILSDALHDLGDSVSLGGSWYLDRVSKRGKDKRFSYGYMRFSLLAALLNTLILLAGGIFVISEAIPRLFNPEAANAQGMLVFALAGILINGIAALRLRGSQSLNVQSVAWHLVEDVLGWVAVLIASIVLLFWDVPILDPLLSLMITLYVMGNVARNLLRTTRLFLQAVPENIEVDAVEKQLLAMDNVQSVHHTHIWSLDGEHHVLTTHVVVEACTTRDQVLALKEKINALTGSLNLEHTTLEIEYEDENCRMKD